MQLKYHTSPSIIDEDFLVKIYEEANTTPGAEVYITTLPKDVGGGHPASQTVIAAGLDKVVHRVRMYSAVSLVLLHDFTAEPKTDIVTVFQPIRFVIGDGLPDTPAADQNTATTPQLAGLSTLEFLIFRNGFGLLFPGIHFDFDTPTGTWNLIQPGDVFGGDPAEQFTILQQPSVVSTVVNDSVVGKWFGGFVDIAANTNYDFAHLRKLIRFSGSPTYHFNIDPPIGYGFCFQHFGTDGAATIAFDNAPLRWTDGADKATLELKARRECCVVFDGVKWNVVYLCDSDFAEDPGITPGTIMGSGLFAVGDVGGGDPSYTVTHNLNITGDYLVFMSIRSNVEATAFRDNKLCWSWYHHATDKPNKFKFTMQELSSEVQNISMAWLIIKN